MQTPLQHLITPRSAPIFWQALLALFEVSIHGGRKQKLAELAAPVGRPGTSANVVIYNGELFTWESLKVKTQALAVTLQRRNAGRGRPASQKPTVWNWKFFYRPGGP